ncbi:hypothetical protein Tco_1025963 [Tanacetum coccineum]
MKDYQTIQELADKDSIRLVPHLGSPSCLSKRRMGHSGCASTTIDLDQDITNLEYVNKDIPKDAFKSCQLYEDTRDEVIAEFIGRQLVRDKLTRPNLCDWERDLQIVLRHGQKFYVLKNPIGPAPMANAPTTIKNAYHRHVSDLLNVRCLMLATMEHELQVKYMDVRAFHLITQPRLTFQTQARYERFNLIVNLSNCKIAEGSSVSAHVIKMIGHISRLERLGHTITLELAIDFILNSLSKEYKQFILNYNMNNVEGETVVELHKILKTSERVIEQKSKDVLVVANRNHEKSGSK